MLPARIPRTLPPRQKRQRAGDDRNHLVFIRSLPCCVCAALNQEQRYPTEAHHLMAAVDGLPRGKSRKNEDRWALPVCVYHHRANVGGRHSLHGHGNDEAFLTEAGVEARGTCKALWSVFQNKDPEDRYQAGLRIVERCKRVTRVEGEGR